MVNDYHLHAHANTDSTIGQVLVLARYNKITIRGTPQMAVDKEANSLLVSRVYSYYSCNLSLFYTSFAASYLMSPAPLCEGHYRRRRSTTISSTFLEHGTCDIVTGKRRSTTIAATPDDGKSQRKRRRGTCDIVADTHAQHLDI